MKKSLIWWSLLIVVYLNLLPFVARFPHGWERVAQLLPDGGESIATGIFGTLFFVVFGSIPALPIIGMLFFRKYLAYTFVVGLVVTTGLVGALHYFLDLSADAQSAVALVFGPVYIAVVSTAICAIIGVPEFFIRRKRLSRGEESAG